MRNWASIDKTEPTATAPVPTSGTDVDVREKAWLHKMASVALDRIGHRLHAVTLPLGRAARNP